MNRPIPFTNTMLLVGCLAILASSGLSANSSKALMRPKLVTTFTSCVQLSEWGTYKVKPGTMIEIDICYVASQECSPKYTFHTQKKNVVVPTRHSPLRIVSGELTGEPVGQVFMAHYFKANKIGHECITFSVGGQIYEYFINVE